MKNWLKKKIAGIIRFFIEETEFSQLNADVAELNKTKSEFEQRLDDYVASVKGITTTLEKEKATFNEEKTELVRKIDDCVFSAKAAIDKTNGLRTEITVLNDKIAGFNQRIDDRVDSVEGIWAALEKEKATFNEEKTELIRKIDDCVFSAKAAIDKTNGLRTEITVLNDKIAGFDQRIDDRVDSIEGIWAALEREKAAFNEEKSKLVREVDDNVFFTKETTDNTDELNNKIIALHGEIIGLDKRVDDYAASVNVIADRIDNFESQLSKLFKKVDDYSEQNVKLAEKVQIFAEALENILSSSENLKNWDDAKAGERHVLTIKGVEFAFRYCPPGNFMTESPDDQGQSVVTISEGFSYCSPGNIMIERPNSQGRRVVTISEGFWICEVPITQAQWKTVGIKKANQCNFRGAKLPVENVTWYESDAFIKKLNELGVVPNSWSFKLPTEIQWEYACRAGTTDSTYGVPLDEAAWYVSNSGKKTHEVGTKRPNKWGIFDMLGNVWEWTSAKSINESLFVMRGGSFNSVAQSCRSEGRLNNVPSAHSISLGFRCVLVRQLSK